MSARAVVVVFLSLFALIMPHSYLSAQTESAEESVTRGATQCAVDLYRQIASDVEIASDEENIFISPYSIYTILALLHGGARGETADQIADLIHLELEPEEFQSALAGIQATLGTIRDAGEVELAIANALFPQIGAVIKDEFYDLAARYLAEILHKDYRGDPSGAKDEINEWAADRTHGRIPEIIYFELHRETHLLLANAIYFSGDWANRFDEAETAPAPFHTLRGQSVSVDMMEQTRVFRYLETDSVQVLELPYVGEAVSMLIVLPRAVDGIRSVEAGLTADEVMERPADLSHELVEVHLPRFTLFGDYNLIPTVRNLGMVNGTRPSLADFTGIGMSRAWFYVYYFVHQAFVDVNEKGTEAAAVTVAGCFPAGTPVLTGDGAVSIENIEPGTAVQAFDLASGRWTSGRVAARHAYRFRGEMITVTAGGHAVQATWNHPFLVVRGDDLHSRPRPMDLPDDEAVTTPHGRWVEADDLRVGDVLLSGTYGEVIVASVSREQRSEEVYALEMLDHHNHTAGSIHALVHNGAAAEEKCEAAPEPIPFIADHPFLFMIRDTPTGNILFMGRVGNPPPTDLSAR